MTKIAILLLAATGFAVPACTSEIPAPTDDDGLGSDDDGPAPVRTPHEMQLDERVTDYSAALKIAALRLTGDVPTMSEINAVATATGAAQKAAYEALVRDFMSRPAFARQAMAFWRDTFKVGGSAMLDTAPALAARLTVENGSYLELFTRTTSTCPTFDAQTGTFADGECTNGGPKAGVLTDTGVQASYFSNFAFRRVRWVQETFDCTRFPAEVAPTPTDVGGAAVYTGVWPFDSIAGADTGGRVDFKDTGTTVCANCHSSLNHQAPLFAYYDAMGIYRAGSIQVPTPLDGAPTAVLADYLPATETTAWRFGKPTADLPAYGAAMAADPAVARCGVARVWNWALGATDIVDTLADVPASVIQPQLDAFSQGGYRLKDLVFAAFTSDDAVKF